MNSMNGGGGVGGLEEGVLHGGGVGSEGVVIRCGMKS